VGRLEGKVALVTGGAGAIGRATARRLADEGARVVVADIDRARPEDAARDIRAARGAEADSPAEFPSAGPRNVIGLPVDVTSEASVRDLVDRVLAEWGTIDVLFTCAGVLVSGSVTETSLEDWQRTIAVNVTGPFLCSKYVVPVMLAAGGGAIIHMSSTAGLVGEASIAAYAASKGAVLMLGRQMAVDFARSGIRVNVICPGWIDTPFNRPAIEEAGGTEALQPFIDMMVPLGRQGRPEEVADVVVFLASDESRLMTGSVVVVDGGLTAQ